MQKPVLNVKLICLHLLALAMAIPAASHTLPEDAPESSALERYEEKIYQARIDRIVFYELEIKKSESYFRREYGRMPRRDNYTRLAERDVNRADLYYSMKDALSGLKRDETSGILVSLDVVNPVAYDTGLLHQNIQGKQFFFVVKELLSEDECRIAVSYEDRSGTQGELHERYADHFVRDILIVGASTENLIVDEQLPVHWRLRPHEVIGVRDNSVWMIHPIMSDEDGISND